MEEITAIFQENGLKIDISSNLKIVYFIDVTQNPDKAKHSPYMKTNDKPQCDPNHSKHILKQIPISINQRLSNNSSSKEDFDAATKPYQDALDTSHFEQKLQCIQPTAENEAKSRNRKGKKGHNLV